MLRRVQLAGENPTTRFATDIGLWLADHVQEKMIPFTFRITAERELNSYALPGGPVFLSLPLLEACQGERDEIAFILAHEMAHIVLRHAVDRIVRDSLFSLLLQRSAARSAAGAWLGKVGQQTLSRAYSRENELEADAFALSLIRTCGGDETAGERLFEKLARGLSSQSVITPGEYFATHPPLIERLAHLRSKRMPLIS
jgi:Zn-dependent protease with chaperone function